MTESIERRKNKGNDGAIGHVAYELGPLLEIRNGKLTMNVECLIVFAFPDGVGDFAFDFRFSVQPDNLCKEAGNC